MRDDWVETEIGVISYLKAGTGFSKLIQGKLSGEFPFFKVGDISKNVQAGNRFLSFCDNYIDYDDIDKIDNKVIPKGSVVFAKIGEALKLNRRAITSKNCLIDNNAIALKAKNDLIENIYLYFYFLTIKLEKYSRATTVPSVRKSDIEGISLPLPPLPEQRAIVAKIEQLFSSLDQGITDLEKAQAQLKIYRQAVLKKAFEGELTKEWREKQTDLPTADELLSQIKEERQRHYQQQVEAWEKKVKTWEAGGKEGKKPGKPKKLKELPTITEGELSVLPDLPNGWTWSKIGNSCQKISDGPFGSHLKTADYVTQGVRVIRLENIKNLFFENSYKTYVSQLKYDSISNHTVFPGDIIFSTFISAETKVAIVPNYIKYAINKADCLCIRPFKVINNRYVEYFLSTRFTYSLLANQVHGATRPRINTTQLKSVPLPLCSEIEQHQIVQAIEARLSVCDKVEQTITESLEKAKALRQSILKKAFEGRLLSEAELTACKQAKDYEPAGELLKKIQAEKAEKEAQAKQIKKKKTTGKKTRKKS